MVALGQLTPLQREAWIDIRFRGETFRSFGERLGFSHQNAYQLVSKADRKLDLMLNGHE